MHQRLTKKEVALSYGTPIETFTAAIVTEWGFDKNNRMTSHKDDGANTSTWTYDALDRVTELKYPDLETIAYVMDVNGNVTKTTDPAGNVMDDTYDANNRRTARTVTRATGFLGTTGETFAYDGLGRMTQAADNDYKVEYTYAVNGFGSYVYEEKQSYVGGTAYTKTVTKAYDAAGNKVAELYPSGLDLDYTWNAIQRLATVTDGTNTIASFTYSGARRKDVTLENGTTTTYSYTGYRSEVSRILHETSSPATIVDLQYGYDANHDRLYERYGGTSALGDVFEYDKARRLTLAWMGSADVTAASSSAYVKKLEFAMDDDGNRTSVKVTPYGQSQQTTSYTSNSLNQYTAVGGASPTHDDNGNLTSDGTLAFEYDYKNQIVRVKQSSTTIAEYKYDALGRRVEKDDQTNVERYVYSGYETISVYDGSNAWKKDFVFGEGIDEVLLLAQEDLLDFDSDMNTTEVTRSYYHANALGSIMAITDANEAEVVKYRYDPYGKVTITRNGTPQSSDPLGNPWTYTGRFSDEETGLMYYRARAYSPDTGRFLQRDPLGYAPSPSLYQYGSSRPSTSRDPFGLDDAPRSRPLASGDLPHPVTGAPPASGGAPGAATGASPAPSSGSGAPGSPPRFDPSKYPFPPPHPSPTPPGSLPKPLPGEAPPESGSSPGKQTREEEDKARREAEGQAKKMGKTLLKKLEDKWGGPTEFWDGLSDWERLGAGLLVGGAAVGAHEVEEFADLWPTGWVDFPGRRLGGGWEVGCSGRYKRGKNGEPNKIGAGISLEGPVAGGKVEVEVRVEGESGPGAGSPTGSIGVKWSK
ncbi:MAG: RHS repeat-associated core domain-containing protein [Planctomycetota bacterium]|nr:RHS repeat-associated core domain-containing protein [Planctomycetota bacterium]